jgi:uncharacterized protein
MQDLTFGRRIRSIDILRGFALLGILVMNIQSFSMPDAAYLNPSAYGDLTGANRWVWILGHLLTDEKMYGIFSMLFGAGILLMAGRAENRGEQPGPLHYRRMGWLMLFGLLHGHLLWPGDILWCYGVSGLVVYLFRKQPPRTLLANAVVFFAIGSVVFAAVGLFVGSLPPDQFDAFAQENWRPTPEMIRDEIATMRGGWLQQMPLRINAALEFEILVLLILYGWKTIGNMLLGMALFKWGVVTGDRPRATYVRMTAAGVLVGFPIVAFGIWRNFAAGWDARYSFFFGSQYNYWGAIVVDMGWIGVIMLVCASGRLTRLKAALAALGRTAFSNYILQTLICSALFYGNGFALFGRVSRVQQILIVVAIWIVQLVLSPLWLRRFAFGPLEWLWRSLTYWRRIPFVGPSSPSGSLRVTGAS